MEMMCASQLPPYLLFCYTPGHSTNCNTILTRPPTVLKNYVTSSTLLHVCPIYTFFSLVLCSEICPLVSVPPYKLQGPPRDKNCHTKDHFIVYSVSLQLSLCFPQRCNVHRQSRGRPQFQSSHPIPQAQRERGGERGGEERGGGRQTDREIEEDWCMARSWG